MSSIGVAVALRMLYQPVRIGTLFSEGGRAEARVGTAKTSRDNRGTCMDLLGISRCRRRKSRFARALEGARSERVKSTSCQTETKVSMVSAIRSVQALYFSHYRLKSQLARRDSRDRESWSFALGPRKERDRRAWVRRRVKATEARTTSSEDKYWLLAPNETTRAIDRHRGGRSRSIPQVWTRTSAIHTISHHVPECWYFWRPRPYRKESGAGRLGARLSSYVRPGSSAVADLFEVHPRSSLST